MASREDIERAIRALGPNSNDLEINFTHHAPKILRELADKIESGAENLKSAAWHCNKTTPHIKQMIVTIEL